jgi:Tol biopolymer transport system component/predicted Ser/Thr protein kinase
MQPGTRLGPYEIISALGAGGMGEVYKAADTRLNRTVAIKVLPEHFSENADMKQRFEREAQAIASLNHPHICTLYDVGRQDSVNFLVMEYLEGESLAQRISRGAIPLEEALPIAIAIADALDKAHNKGVTHRDLKPGNVMLTATGAKLLDFGLAKVRQQSPASGSSRVGATGMLPDTSATTPGTILGTMQYMAPEQLSGEEADARSDIFAFGALLYEMVSGKKAFEGKSQAHLIAAIVSVDPEPLSAVQPMTPPALEFVVKRCLAKDREERLQTAWDLLSQLKWIAEGGTQVGLAAPVSALRRKQSRMARLALTGAAALLILVGVPALLSMRGSETLKENRFLIGVPDMPTAEAVSISPDGRLVAYSARDGASTSIFVRPVAVEVPQKLPGTEGAGRLFWAPDNRTIAFFAGGKLRRIEADGGRPQNICETPDMLGGSWNEQNTIIFASSQGLMRVLATGGQPAPLPKMQEKRTEPVFLPDGHHYLFLSSSDKPENAAIFAGSIDSPDSNRVVAAQSNAIYVKQGYLFYHREGTLFAQAFNAKSLSVSGEPQRIADGLPYGKAGAAAFAASQTGILIYRNDPPQAGGGGASNGNLLPQAPLLWVDRMGRKAEQVADSSPWAGLDLSPDGRRSAVHRHDPEGGDIWIFETGVTAPSKFTFDAAQDNSSPVWSPDGTSIAFASKRNGKSGLYLKRADNTRNEELLVELDTTATPMGWSPDGKLLVYSTRDPRTEGDIWALPIADKKPISILQTSADERNPQVSPDGKWIAYSSNESGRTEIYIKSFPEGPAKIQVSVDGGLFPRWRRDGKELYFLNPISMGNMMATEIRMSDSSVQRTVPEVLFQTQFINGAHGGPYHAYAVAANGQRFLINQFETPQALYASGAVGRGRNATLTFILPGVIADRHSMNSSAIGSAPITVVLHWTALLQK